MLRLKYGVGDDACGCACCHAYRTKCHVDGEVTDSIMHCHMCCKLTGRLVASDES